MKKALLTLGSVIMFVVSYSQTLTEKLDQYFTAAENAGIFNGSVLVAKDNEVVLHKGYGFSNAELKSRNEANTIYQIGSLTKQFTATIVLKLAEQGKLSLGDKLSKYLPEYEHADKITIEQLLSHTAGVYNYTSIPGFMVNEVEKPFSKEKLFKAIKGKPLDFEPGSKFSYSNSGYLILGYVIEKITGEKYESAVRKHIFNPLGMTNSGFDYKNLQHKNKAIGYTAITNTTSIPQLKVDSTVTFSAGGMYTTIGDMYKWNQSLFSENVLTKASIENAFTPRKSGYGLGWTADSILGSRIISHTGGVHGFLTISTLIPAKGIQVIIFSNSETSKVNVLHNNTLAILYDKPYKLPEAVKEITLPEATLRQYVGEYQLAPNFIITITVSSGQLKGQATAQPSFDLFAKSENVFFAKVAELQIEFSKDGNGAVEKMTLHQNGQKIPGKKIK